MRIPLFQINNNNKLDITIEALTVTTFRELWERDKSDKKSHAIRDLSYIFWMGDFMSPYLSLKEDERHKEVVVDIIEDETYKPDEMVLKGLKKYEEFQEVSNEAMVNLKSVREAARRLREFFNDENILKKTDKSGRPIYKPKDITSAIQEYTKVIDSIDKWMAKIKNEMTLGDETIRGGGQAGDYEDPEKATYLNG